MNLKNGLFKQIFFGAILLALVTALQSSSCSDGAPAGNNHDSTAVDTTEPPLPPVFVNDSVGQARGGYFKAHKDTILQCNNFYFANAQLLQAKLKDSAQSNLTGLRIYIAQTDKDSNNNIALIFSPTIQKGKTKYADLGKYAILMPGVDTFMSLNAATAEHYVNNYKTGNKKRRLDSTLTAPLSDSDYSLGETTSLLYDSSQINQICGEMNYQHRRNNSRINGMWIALTAHTATDTFPQRLNLEVAFAGTDAKHSPISIENINHDDYKKRPKPARKPMITETAGGLDSGYPCPPASTSCSGAELD